MSLHALRDQGPSPELEGQVLLGDDRITVAPTAEARLDGTCVSGTASRVPWARRAERIALILGGRVHLVARDRVEIEAGANIAGEERDTVVLKETPAEALDDVDPDALLLRGALVRVALMAGSLERITAITIAHARERMQFGRPIGSFQAVQAHLVTTAQQAALVGVAADAAIERERGFEVAVAKLLANRAAVIAGRAAHQVLGARGTTLEHPLSLHTRRLWAWRTEYGDERFWSTQLGSAAVGAGADRLYPTITAGSGELKI